MVNTKELKAAIMRKGLTQGAVAKHLNMTERTFSSKINNKSIFGSDEIEKIVLLLDIDNPIPIFLQN